MLVVFFGYSCGPPPIKHDRHDIFEILLKVVLNTITLPNPILVIRCLHFFWPQLTIKVSMQLIWSVCYNISKDIFSHSDNFYQKFLENLLHVHTEIVTKHEIGIDYRM